jgi:bacterioferritin-associated ferredoxin
VDLDRKVCLCFDVTLRKLLQFLRVTKPHCASQLSECGGAGTGCGWCRPFLEQLHRSHRAADLPHVLPDPARYRADRTEFLERRNDSNRS